MTEPGLTPGEHVSIDTLADAAEDLLDPQDAARVRTHVASCTECTEAAESLRAASAAIRDLPAPPMPSAVFDRLTAVVRAESERRATGIARAEEEAEKAEAFRRTDLGSFGQNPPFGKSVPLAESCLISRQHPSAADEA